MMIEPIAPNIPTIGQRQTAAKAMVAQGLQQLAMQIYAQLAVSHYPVGESLDGTRDTLTELARYSMQAAKMYFAGLGIAQFQENQPNG